MSTPAIRPPRRYRRLLDRVMARDAAMIARHHGGERGIRPYVPGEAWPAHDPNWSHVLVSPIAPGVRLRQMGHWDGETFDRAGSPVEIVDQDDPGSGRLVPPEGVELLGVVDCREGGSR